MRHIGVCYDSGAWGGDLSGLLVAEGLDGWKVVTGHISSSVTWSEQDIGHHFKRVEQPGDTYEWAGLMTADQINERFGWGQQGL